MSLETLSYMGLANCIKLSNGIVDVIASTAVGPRLLFYGPTGGSNVLAHFRKRPRKLSWAYGSRTAVIVSGCGPKCFQPSTLRITIRSSIRLRASTALCYGSLWTRPACKRRSEYPRRLRGHSCVLSIQSPAIAFGRSTLPRGPSASLNLEPQSCRVFRFRPTTSMFQ